jgi:hypothetical protein
MLQENKTKLSKEGEEEGREEENNPLERWYLEKKRRNNKDHNHRYKQCKVVEGMVPRCMAANSIPNTSLDVHLIAKQEQIINASTTKKLTSFMVSQMQDFGKKCEAFGN